MHAALLFLVLAGAPTETGPSAEAIEPRGFHEISDDIRELFRREVRAKTDGERAAAVYEMTELYQEIRHDPRLPTSDTLKEYKAKLWSRMTRVKNDINKRLARESRRGGRSKTPPLDPAQRAAADRTAASTAGHLDLVGGALGGPGSLFAQAGARGGRAIPDYGPELVDLIERTIAPEFWDVHGGPGTIVYYKPLMALVVRATSEVHHRVGGTLGALRAAGR